MDIGHQDKVNYEEVMLDFVVSIDNRTNEEVFLKNYLIYSVYVYHSQDCVFLQSCKEHLLLCFVHGFIYIKAMVFTTS